MPIFKQKHDKNIKCDNKTFVTLDTKHTLFLKEFHDNEHIIIPNLKKERAELKKQLEDNKNISIEDFFKLEELIDEKTLQIKTLKIKKRDYFQNNSKLIFDYFENKKNLEQLSLHSSVAKNAMVGTKTKMLQSFFKMDNANNSDPVNNECMQINNMTNNMSMKYFYNVDDTFIDVNKFLFSSDVCLLCKKGELIPYEDEGIMICNNCAHNFPYLLENQKQSYKETPKEICCYAYKRLNHFKEVLAQFQAKETTQISPEVIVKIQHQIKKERINLKDLTNETMREILRKLGYDSKFYEHIPFIKHKMGIAPVIMSRELEEDLYNDFNELQSPYAKYCPDNRENFLSYNYTAYKLCERRGHHEFLPHFHMIKDRNKTLEHDSIWEKICGHLGWQFIPTP